MARADQAYDKDTIGRWCAQNRRQNFSIRLAWQKIDLFSGLGRYRRTPPASSHPLDHGHPISSRPSSTLVGLVGHRAGWPWAEPMSRSSVDGRTSSFLSACWQFATRKKNCAACSRWGEKKKKTNIFFSFSPQRQYEEFFGCSLKAIYLKTNFWTSHFYWHRSKRPNIKKKKKQDLWQWERKVWQFSLQKRLLNRNSRRYSHTAAVGTEGKNVCSYLFVQTAAGAAILFLLVANRQQAGKNQLVRRIQTFDLDIDSAHGQPAWCRARPTSVDDGLEDIVCTHDLLIGGESFCRRRPTVFYPHLKKYYFLPLDTDREILSSVLCRPAVNSFSLYAWPAPATITGHCVNTWPYVAWVGAPNERTPFRFHDAVVGFVDRCLSKTDNLAASSWISAWVFLKPILNQRWPQIFFCLYSVELSVWRIVLIAKAVPAIFWRVIYGFHFLRKLCVSFVIRCVRLLRLVDF